MSSSSQSRQQQSQALVTIDDKYNEAYDAARKHMQAIKSRKSTKKPSQPTSSSPVIDDFVLFSDCKCKAQDTTQTLSSKRSATIDSSSTTEPASHLAATTKARPQVAPSRRDRAPRHGGFQVVDLGAEHGTKSDNGGASNRRTSPTPPAPMPPALDSPDISDVEEDTFWCEPHRRR